MDMYKIKENERASNPDTVSNVDKPVPRHCQLSNVIETCKNHGTSKIADSLPNAHSNAYMIAAV
jgi:hypothetical protein